MPDPLFDDPRLAALYDPLEDDRSDLDVYLAVADELSSRRVLDIGCGTGTFALRVAASGREAVGVDPSSASLDVARRKPGAEEVRWVHGVTADVDAGVADLAVMTGNVAQAIADPGAWTETLRAAYHALTPGGHLVLETRDPDARGWEAWRPELSRRTVDVPGAGAVETWVELVDVALPLVSFRWTYVFAADGATLTSDSTLRFRGHDEVVADLGTAGFDVVDVRGAPDRPGLELVFVARRPTAVSAGS